MVIVNRISSVEWAQPSKFSFCSFLLTVHSLFHFALRLLVDTVVHFPPSLEEVTVSVSDERMWVRNHVEEEGGTIIFFSPNKLSYEQHL